TRGFIDVNKMIRIKGAWDEDHERVNTCVAPGFACGLNIKVPTEDTWDYNIVNDGLWTFVNYLHFGFYAAVYSDFCDSEQCWRDAHHGYVNFGFFEAASSEGLRFEDFMRGVKSRNPGPFYSGGDNKYVTTAGREIHFSALPDPDNNKWIWGIT